MNDALSTLVVMKPQPQRRRVLSSGVTPTISDSMRASCSATGSSRNTRSTGAAPRPTYVTSSLTATNGKVSIPAKKATTVAKKTAAKKKPAAKKKK